MAGLTNSGYVPRTSGEWLDFATARFTQICADLGLTAPRYDRAEFAYNVLLVAAQMAGEIDDALSNIFDQHDPNQASGFILRYIADISGVPVNQGTKSTVTLTLSAWDQSDVSMSAGGVKATDGTNVWVLKEDVVVPKSGASTNAIFEAEEVGPIYAAAQTITQKVTGIAGWVNVKNVDASTVGTAADTDAIIRNRIAQGLGSTGSRSEISLRVSLESLPDVEKARIVYNPEIVATTVSSVSIPANGVAVWLYPSTLTAATQSLALNTLFALLPGNVVRTHPTTTGSTGVVGEIAGADGRPHKEGFFFMTTQSVRVKVQISAASGYEAGGTLSGVSVPVQNAVTSYFTNLGPGDAVRQQDIIGAVVLVAGVARVTVTLSTNAGVSYSDSDIVVDAATFAVLDPATTTPIIVEQVA